MTNGQTLAQTQLPPQRAVLRDRTNDVVASNPLKLDPVLCRLLDKIEHVNSYRSFRRWRNSFLDRFESFLLEANVLAAHQAYLDFGKRMGAFVPDVDKVERYIEKGELTVLKYTVKARNAFAEMCKDMTACIDDLEALIPQTGHMEKKRGYNKFHIAAVLVRDGFEEYGRLSQCGDVLRHMREVSLNEVADKQILEEMDRYNIKLQLFCDVMADLGLYTVMLKCRQFANAEDSMDDILFLDLKTGCIGSLERADCLVTDALHVKGHDENGNELFTEAAPDRESRDKVVKLIMASKRLGIGFGNIESEYAAEVVVVSDVAAIQNKWGVKLKKTPKNVKGEEFIFLCQKTGALGELSRKACLEKQLITEMTLEGGDGKDGKGGGGGGGGGAVVLEQAEVNHVDRSNTIELIRTLL